MHRSTLALAIILFVPLAVGAFFSSEISSGFKTAFMPDGIDRSMLTANANATHLQEKGKGSKSKPEKKEKKNKDTGSEMTDSVPGGGGGIPENTTVNTETVSLNSDPTTPAPAPASTNIIVLTPATTAPLSAENSVTQQQPASQTSTTSSMVPAVNTASPDTSPVEQVSVAPSGSGSPVSGFFSAVAELFSPTIKVEHTLDTQTAHQNTAVSVKTKSRAATALAGRAEGDMVVEQPTAAGETANRSIDNSFMAQVSNERIFAMVQNAGRSIAEFWNTRIRTAFRSVRELLASVAHSMTATVSFGE